MKIDIDILAKNKSLLLKSFFILKSNPLVYQQHHHNKKIFKLIFGHYLNIFINLKTTSKWFPIISIIN